jgi:hypothetical protein
MSPSVNLDLEEVPFAILEAVKARIMANRRRLGVGREGEQPPPSLKPRPQLRKFGASGKNYRRPEPAATGGGDISPHNILWYSIRIRFIGDPGNDTVLKLYSGDLSKSLTIEFDRGLDYAGQYGMYTQFACLPLDGTTCIAILYYVTSGGGFIGPIGPTTHKAFIVGRSSVRQLSNVPNKIKSLFRFVRFGPADNRISQSVSCVRFGDLLATPVRKGTIQLTENDTYLDNFVTLVNGFRESILEFGISDYIEKWLLNLSGVSYVTPAAFKILNSTSAFNTALLGLGSSFGGEDYQSYYYPPSSRGSMYTAFSDNLPDKYRNKWLAVSRLDPTFATALRYASDLPPNVVTFSDVNGQDDSRWKRLRRNPLIAQKPPAPQYAAQAATWLAPYFYWDWGNPDYCREQLLALGFTSSDLTP